MLSFILYSERKSYLICFHSLLQIHLICQKKGRIYFKGIRYSKSIRK